VYVWMNVAGSHPNSVSDCSLDFSWQSDNL